jgi:putative FmdB family regulatory protein
MPLCNYSCKSCGGFREWQPMSASEQSVSCPRCGSLSPRSIIAPTILRTDPYKRTALTRNEKSAHEPRVERREKVQPRARHAHPHGDNFHRLGPHLHKSSRRWMAVH